MKLPKSVTLKMNRGVLVEDKKFIFLPYDKEKSVEVEEGYVIDNYLTKDMGMGHSLVRSHLNGKHPRMKNVGQNRTYYFINGSGEFVVEGERVKVKEGDVLVIPKNTIYEFEGVFDAILISCPGFDPKDDVIYRD